jgi:hypothetical protein
MFKLFRFEAKQSQKFFFFVSLRSETKNQKRNEKFLEAKQSKYTVYLFRFGWKRKIRSEKKQNEAKKKKCSCERAKRMRNESRFASFRFEAKKILKRNRRTLHIHHTEHLGLNSWQFGAMISATTDMTIKTTAKVFQAWGTMKHIVLLGHISDNKSNILLENISTI